MKKLLKKIILVLCVLVIVITVAYLLVMRFQNIDMTETRLFVTYWKEIIASFSIIMGSGILFVYVS